MIKDEFEQYIVKQKGLKWLKIAKIIMEMNNYLNAGDRPSIIKVNLGFAIDVAINVGDRHQQTSWINTLIAHKVLIVSYVGEDMKKCSDFLINTEEVRNRMRTYNELGVEYRKLRTQQENEERIASIWA